MSIADFPVRPVPAGDVTLPDDLHPVLRRIYLARGVRDAAELDLGSERLLDPAQLKGADAGAAMLADAITRHERILIVGDYDADGATATAVAVRALRAFGARHVDYFVPDRFRYGYGLTPAIIEAAAPFRPDLVVTVDNGIASIEGAAAARAAGIRLIITDHHLPGEDLPDADVIINPNQPEDDFTSKAMAGVGVIFYLMIATRACLRERDHFQQSGITEPNLAELLDIVALGTVADLVPLDHNNRILIALGLGRINRGRACAGIRALIDVAGKSAGDLVARDLGFMIAPRLNAAGRLEDMSRGIACLITDDASEARQIAAELDELNRVRREMQMDMEREAQLYVERLALADGDMPAALCLFDENWHQGIVGLVASRIKERVHRPVIAFAPADDADTEEIKGSARSVEGVHIRDALDAVATNHPGLLLRFGGHAMAAGLSLRRSDLDRFSAALSDTICRMMPDDFDHRGLPLTDGPLVDQEITLDLAERVRQAGPWGQGFTEPVFSGIFEVQDASLVGGTHLRMHLAGESGRACEAIAFGVAPDGLVPKWTRIQAAYRLEVNIFRGQRRLQLVIEHLTELD